MEEVANRIVRRLYEQMISEPGNTRACALVRTFVTLPYADLQPDQQEFARRLLPDIAKQPSMRCLTLLATAGDEAAWNSRRGSIGHQALPLPSPSAVERFPMISQLIRQLGIEIGSLLQPPARGVMLDESQHTFNVFHVPEALGSPFIPAQAEFVQPYGIKSVLGFGGLLLPGELFATILFSRAPISRDTAALFRTLTLNVKVAMLPFTGGRVFS